MGPHGMAYSRQAALETSLQNQLCQIYRRLTPDNIEKARLTAKAEETEVEKIAWTPAQLQARMAGSGSGLRAMALLSEM